jgi:hypothetical protein
MAQIKILGNVNSSSTINRFNVNDISLIGTQTIVTNFNPDTDYIEYTIYDIVGNFIDINYNYQSYSLPSNSSYNIDGTFPVLEINPTADLQAFTNVGEFAPQYSFFKRHISDYINRDLFIKEISPDRTELKISSVTLSSGSLEQQANALIDDKNSVPYLKTYLLNFGDNNVLPITNIALDKSNPNEYYILFKLYEPLPSNIVEKDTFWVVEEIINAVKFDVTLESQIIPDPLPQLRGANFDIEVAEKNTLPTQYESHNTLLQFTGSSLHAILNHLDQQSIQINVNYSGSFNDFVRFGSAEKRVENFYGKVKQIEDYNNFITNYSSSVATTSSLQTLINQYSSSINDIVSKFDGYESYLYFETGSGTWPKSTSTAPYTLQSTGSATAITWYNNTLDLAINYDVNNADNLVFLVPEYIRIDENNTPYLTFINMIGHYFDNIWIYLKSVTDLYKSYNNLDQGVSRDLVYYALQDLGVNIYNSSEDDNLGTYAVAISGSNVPSKDLIAELYKRIYHNVPLLFKGKGSKRGLQELVTTFGITGSILGIKEYGGNTNTAASLIDSNSNKVRIVNNTVYSSSYYGVTGSVLSPNIKLATDNLYIDYKNDSDRVDVSFSPQNQLDVTISSSVATLYPSFSIDDYIGDPRTFNDVEYTNLNNVRYQAISSSFSYSYDINGFIQLIKYFDNTLFKMLKNYVPAKANLTEGVTIRQQSLERIKFKRNEPNITEQTVYDAEYNGPTITEDNTYYYDKLGGNKVAFYDGTIPGSTVDLFVSYSGQFNPYIHPTSSVNQYQFEHTDYNVLLNNVSASRLSLDRLKVEKQPYSTQSLLLPVALQDSYESLASYNLSRHEGVKIYSSKYNTYTITDKSYGKAAVIDRNSYKLALFTDISSNTFLPSKYNIRLKYLVDADGNLTELNNQQLNWFEVQNTFKKGTNSVITLFDPQKYGNQKQTNGSKLTYDSGYSYNPILFFYIDKTTDAIYNSSTEQRAYFSYNGDNPYKLFKAKNNIPAKINGYSTNNYPLVGGKVYDAFNNAYVNDGLYYTPGSSGTSTYPTYSSPAAGTYTFNADLDLTINFGSSGGTTSFAIDIISGSTVIGTQTQTFNLAYYLDNSALATQYGGYYTPSSTIPWVLPQNVNFYSGNTLNATLPAGTTVNIYQYDLYRLSVLDQRFFFVYYGGKYYQFNTSYVPRSIQTSANWILYSNGTQPQTKNFNLNATANLKANDKVEFRFYLASSTTSNYTASMNEGLLQVYLPKNQTGLYPYATAAFNQFILTTSGADTFYLDPDISNFYNFIYMPSGSTTLYNTSDDTTGNDYPFAPKAGDIMYFNCNNYDYEFTITEVSNTDTTINYMKVTPTIPSGFVNLLYSTPKSYFALLSRVEDETNAVLKFNKKEGQVSYGLLIPSDIDSTVLSNINTITEKVKQRLIGDQSIISQVGGGTF